MALVRFRRNQVCKVSNSLPPKGGVMRQFFVMKQVVVLGAALLALTLSGCATRGYARRQARTVNDRVTQVQTQITGLSVKHDTDVAVVNQGITAADNKIQQVAVTAEQANAN